MLASVTFDIPQELAIRIRPLEEQVSRILELGLRELSAASQMGFTGSSEILEFLANLPEPDEIIELQPSQELQSRVRQLLEKKSYDRTLGRGAARVGTV